MTITKIPAAKTIEETGVHRNLMEDLALKFLCLKGEMFAALPVLKLSGSKSQDDLYDLPG